MSEYSSKHPFPARLLHRRQLHKPGASKDTRHIEVDLAGSGLTYKPGDSLGVLPRNCPQLVADIVSALGAKGDTMVPTDGGERPLAAILADHQVNLVPKVLVATTADKTGDDHLKGLLGDRRALADHLWGKDVLDWVREHADAGLSAHDLAASLKPLLPRLYSIASSPSAHGDVVHLTVGVVTYEAHGRLRQGVASTWLASRVTEGGTVPCFIHEAKKFALPSDPTVPMIMIGPGTGIAPFRAFLEERRAQGATGDTWLFFGNPHRSTDFIYEDEVFTNEADDHGILTRRDLAFSRDQAHKVYVQHRMLDNATELWSWLDRGAHFYVCGDATRMAKDVDEALHTIIAEHGGKGADGAKDYVKAMKKNGRYQRDVYAT